MPNDQISPLWNMATARRQPYSKVAEKGEGRRGRFPRAALVTALLLTSFYVDLVVS
jgi:hypothetical protein